MQNRPTEDGRVDVVDNLFRNDFLYVGNLGGHNQLDPVRDSFKSRI